MYSIRAESKADFPWARFWCNSAQYNLKYEVHRFLEGMPAELSTGCWNSEQKLSFSNFIIFIDRFYFDFIVSRNGFGSNKIWPAAQYCSWNLDRCPKKAGQPCYRTTLLLWDCLSEYHRSLLLVAHYALAILHCSVIELLGDIIATKSS